MFHPAAEGLGSPAGSEGRRTELGLRMAVLASAFDRFAAPPLLVAISSDLQVPFAQATLVVSAYFVAYGVSQPLWGMLSDRIGRIRVIRAALIGGMVACTLAAFTSSFSVLVGARAAAGLCFAPIVPGSVAYAGDVIPLVRRQRTLTMLIAASALGLIGGTILAGVCAEWGDWQAVFGVSAVCAVIALVAVGGIRSDRGRAPSGKVVRTVIRPWPGAVLLLAFVEGGVVFGSVTFVASALHAAGVGAGSASLAAACFGVGNLCAIPMVARAIRSWSGGAIIAAGGLCGVGGMLVVSANIAMWTSVAAMLALGIAFAFVHSTFQLWVTQMAASARGVLVSIFTGAVFTGGAAASAIGGPLADAGRFSLIFLFAALGCLTIAIAGPLLYARWNTTREPQRRTGGEPGPVAAGG